MTASSRRGPGMLPALMLLRSLLTAAVLVTVAGCVSAREGFERVEAADALIDKTRKLYGSACAPADFANAEADAAFARAELLHVASRRGGQRADDAHAHAERALILAERCAKQDRDQDGYPDVVDRCPDEPLSFKGERDEHGCRVVDPYGDDDGDGILNIDDACIDDPEDFDGHQDDDGCPETSEDSDGDGIPDELDQCPFEAEDYDGYMDYDGCPDPDNDGDGILDIFDRCPNQPEDFDGWEDEDGCPDFDNDGDGIPDEEDDCPNQPGPLANRGCPVNDRDGDGIADDIDQCPDEPETYNDYLDDDGCPDTPPEKVRVTRTRIEINEPINFETGSASIMGDSQSILRSVLAVLKDASTSRVRIEGHTDNVGDDASNQRLSEERAKSVRAWLIRNGVDASRLESVGFGPNRPIDTNRTENGRARNRRVEFHILSR